MFSAMGDPFLSFSEAWSQRAERLGGHAGPSWAPVCAAVALAAFLASTILVMSGALFWPGAEVFQLIGNDQGVFGCIGLLACEDYCPKHLPLAEQIAYLRRRMTMVTLRRTPAQTPVKAAARHST